MPDTPSTTLPQIVRELQVTPFLGGLKEGLDPTLPDSLYPPIYAPDLANIRVANGKWQPRRGMTLWQTLPGSGRVRLLDNMYTSSGQRIRLAARGDDSSAILYDFLEGTDTVFNATTGGTGLGGTSDLRFQMVVLNDSAYFIDRSGALRKYQRAPSSGNQVRTVALPVAPGAAPSVKAKTWDILEQWDGNGGVAPYGWTVADAAKFDLQSGTADIENPLGGTTALLNTLTNPKNSGITENVTAESVPSSTIAFWINAGNIPNQISFQYGIVGATDFTESINPPVKNDWYPVFVRIGNLGTINYKRFVVVKNAGAADTYLSKMVLPGLLQGNYRYVYTHYDPTLKRESAPSAIGNNGTPLDLSVVGTTGQPSSAAAFQKSAALSFTSDSGSDSTTTKIRVYRTGGVSALTKDSRGLDVWCRVGEVFDQSTTLSAGPSAGATSISVTSATNLAIGDWLVIDKGTVSKEEYVRITNIAGTTLTISSGLLYSHTNGHSVQVAFVDNVPNEQVDLSTRIFLERDDPPSGAKFIARTPEGRIWLFNYASTLTGVRVSNRATPDRPTDYEVFPNGVDPISRHDPLQGWSFELGGDATDEQIMWGGLFNDRIYIFTQRHLYAVNAHSQTDWGPDAVTKALSEGCVAGDTVAEIAGHLYWLAPGPRVLRWDGQSAPENISHLAVNERLKAAPAALWRHWFAVPHAEEEGKYLSLYYVPDITGLTTPANPAATVISSSEIDLAWDAVADADSYEVSRSTDGVTFTVIGSVAA